MTLIQFDIATPASVDGVYVQQFGIGATVDAPVAVADSLVAQGNAHYVVVPTPQLAPDAPPAVDAVGLPAPLPANASRADLDVAAAQLGLDPSEHPNKDSVRQAIVEVMADQTVAAFDPTAAVAVATEPVAVPDAAPVAPESAPEPTPAPAEATPAPATPDAVQPA